MKFLALSGWGQPHDTLADVIPENSTHFDYTGYATIEEALAAIADSVKNHNVVIGWSLGGQLAVRAIAAGLMQPEKLILIGVPFQFVQSAELKIGMPRDKFDKFRDNYQKNPARTLAKAWELTALGDRRPKHIRAQFGRYDQQSMLQKDWLRWLDMLDGFSSSVLDFGKFPPSLIIHGMQDKVVDYTQAQEFMKRITGAKHIMLQDAGHAPHWHDTNLIKRHIGEYLDVR